MTELSCLRALIEEQTHSIPIAQCMINAAMQKMAMKETHSEATTLLTRYLKSHANIIAQSWPDHVLFVVHERHKAHEAPESRKARGTEVEHR